MQPQRRGAPFNFSVGDQTFGNNDVKQFEAISRLPSQQKFRKNVGNRTDRRSPLSSRRHNRSDQELLTDNNKSCSTSKHTEPPILSLSAGLSTDVTTQKQILGLLHILNGLEEDFMRQALQKR